MSADAVLKRIKDKGIKYVDLRFTDPRGKWQHVTFDNSMVDEDFLSEGTMFDGSSIAGWKAINESDMILMPDTATAVEDPFFSQPTLTLICDILEPSTRALRRRPQKRSSVLPASATPRILAPKQNSSFSTTCGGLPIRTTWAS